MACFFLLNDYSQLKLIFKYAETSSLSGNFKMYEKNVMRCYFLLKLTLFLRRIFVWKIPVDECQF